VLPFDEAVTRFRQGTLPPRGDGDHLRRCPLRHLPPRLAAAPALLGAGHGVRHDLL